VAGLLAAGGGALALSGRPVLGLIAWMLAAATLIALVRAARRAEGAMREFVDQLAGGVADRPASPPAAFADLDAAMSRALEAMHVRETRHAAKSEADGALLDTVPAALFVTDIAGRLLRYNRAARALASTAPMRFADHPAFASSDAAALLAHGPVAGRMLRLADGRIAHASVSLFSLADGSQRRLIAVQTVSEGLGAVEADAWHRLSRVLAHEMMNSLSPVISLAESLVALAHAPSADPDRRETAAAAATIARRAQHLMGFVERYRQWLAIPEPAQAPVDLAEFAEDMAAIGRGFDPRVDVRVRTESSGITALIDRELIEQALVNLLKNAVEAASECTQPAVDLSYEVSAGILRFAVEDNGVGLGDEAEDIFLPFYTTKTNGAGIGLAIARQIAAAHGGSLTADRMTQGSKFSLSLPGQDV
ncbi:MAG TPA: sensor histidine kinase, partial [Sphingopyxis sp.]|uniref:sensor histidine kinase n=1 Tax=Sphingopyxis sp. TaxID=1908224 RepID=UPI002CF4B170